MYYFQKDYRPDYTLPIAIDFYTHRNEQGQANCFSSHNHEILEILLVQKGTLCVTIDGYNYTIQPGDIAIANPYELHQGECMTASVEYLCITANLTKILPYTKTSLYSSASDLLSGKSRFDSFLDHTHPNAEKLADAFAQLQQALHDKTPDGECVSAGIVFRIFGILFREHYTAGGKSLRGQRDLKFLRSVSEYLFENYSKDISTRSICDHLYMEMPQFCRKFRVHFGSSFSNYLCKYRITNAANLYRGSELPISQIAINVGFSDYCYFSKSFKKYIGQSPAIYFRKWKTSSTMD